MVPATSERNFTPSSTDESGPPSRVAGAAVTGQMVAPFSGGGGFAASASASICWKSDLAAW